MEISIYTDDENRKFNYEIDVLNFTHQSNVSHDRFKTFFLDCIKAFDVAQSKFLADYDFSELLNYDAVITVSVPYVGTPHHRLPAVFTTDITDLSLSDTISPIVYSADAFRIVCDCLQKPFIFVPFVFSNWVKENKDYYSTDLYRITSARNLKKELQCFGLTNQSKVLILIFSYTTGVNKKVLNRTVDTVISICEEL